MKKITSLFVLLIVALSVSCSSSSDGEMSEQTISFKFNGANVTAIVSEAVLFKDQSINEKRLWITAETADKHFEWNFYTTYSINNLFPTGEYFVAHPFDHANMNVSYKIDGNTYEMHYPEDGALTVSSANSKKASGTFNVILHAAEENEDFEFMGVSIPYEINITEGTFSNISYQVANF